MNKQRIILNNILLRYFILVILALNGFALIYLVFTPLTVYFSYVLFKIFFNVSLSGAVIFIGKSSIIEIIGACVAGSAYYLLFLLNLSVQDVSKKNRLKLLLFSTISLLLINVLRIFILGTLFYENFSSFELIHKIIWYFGSIILVALIWFWETSLFKIKEIPFSKDIKFLYKLTKKK